MAEVNLGATLSPMRSCRQYHLLKKAASYVNGLGGWAACETPGPLGSTWPRLQIDGIGRTARKLLVTSSSPSKTRFKWVVHGLS